jgi:hypothetical protein
VQRFRARLVAKGFTQIPGSDFFETYSPVFSYTSFRATLALAAAEDLQIDQWDLKNGFIQQPIDVEHLYVECPDGYSKVMPDGSPAALHCLQSLYGLKQSSRLLHERLSKYLIAIGFRQLVSDQCVFVKGTGKSRVIVCTWVDDIILASPRHDEKSRADFDAALRREFEMSPWTQGQAGWILNMKVQRDWEKGTVHLSQAAAIEKLAAQFKLTGREGSNPWVPMDPTLKLSKPEADKIVPSSEFDYCSAVGGLLYISLTARPDVALAVGVLSRFMSCPGIEHVQAAKKVTQYLYSTKDHGITFSKSESGAPHVYFRGKQGSACDDAEQVGQEFWTYADADLAGDVDTRRSTTGYVVVLSGGLISWVSKLQSTVSLSTAEAETVAATEAVKTVMHLRLFLQELGVEQGGPSIVFEDNQAAIALAHGKEQSKKAKHYQMKVHFLSDQYKRKVFVFQQVDTKSQLADAFTKPLPRDDFLRYRHWMRVRPPPVAAEGAVSS